MYKFEKIVFGATPEAVIFAHKNNLPIIFIKQKAPFFFDSVAPDLPKLEAYKKMLYILSLSGKVPFYDNVGFAKRGQSTTRSGLAGTVPILLRSRGQTPVRLLRDRLILFSLTVELNYAAKQRENSPSADDAPLYPGCLCGIGESRFVVVAE